MTQYQPRGSSASSAASPLSNTPSLKFNTPSSEGASCPLSLPSEQHSRRPSPFKDRQQTPRLDPSYPQETTSSDEVETGFDSDLDLEEDREVMEDRPALNRHADGRSQVPLLKDERGRPPYESPNGSARPAFAARRSTFRSKSPDLMTGSATRKKYTYAAFALGLSLISFVVQTETAVYIQHTLGWKKAYCMLLVGLPSPKILSRLMPLRF